MRRLEPDRYLLVPAARRSWVIVLAAVGMGLMASPLFFFGLFPLIAAIAYARLSAERPPVPGRLEAGAEGVRWDGRLIAPRRQLVAGMVVPHDLPGKPLEVRLVRRFPRGPLRFVAADEPAARALLRELGLDASQVALTLRFGSWLRASKALTVLWALTFVALLPAILIALFVALFAQQHGGMLMAGLFLVWTAVWVVLNVAGSRVRIGADGILLSWLWRTRFVAYDDLEDVRPYVDGAGAGIALRLRGGREVRLPRMGAFTTAIDRNELDLVVHRVRQAVAHQQQAQMDRGLVLPERGGRSASEWIAALRAVGTGASSDHRTAPVGPDRLLRIAEDPGAAPAQRAAAAVALGAVADENGRGRLRVAAEASAEPELRAAMALAAEQEAAEEELAAALERLARRGP
jgi:hypothetical protein